MTLTRSRKWLQRAVIGLAIVLASAASWAGMNYSTLKCRYTLHKLRTATTDEERAHRADQLLALGDDGRARLLGLLRDDDSARCVAVAAAFDRYLAALPDGDPRIVMIAGELLDSFPELSNAGRRAVLGLLPTLLKRHAAADPSAYRPIVAAGLVMPAIDDRLLAIRMAMHPVVKLRADVVPLLDAPEAEIRRAALFAVGPATDDEPVISDEDLFRWLHDGDDRVRNICYDALVSRGRTDLEISLGRRLTHPDPCERLKLLLDLRYDDDVPDPEPWLERLSRDADPAVRTGAARVAVELASERQIPAPIWVGRLAESDPYPTVRQVVGFYRSQPTSPSATGPIQQTGGTQPIP